MARVREIVVQDILSGLPNVVPLDCRKDLTGMHLDLFLCALGFEERCLSLPELLATTDGLKCEESVWFEYGTNVTDNARNRPRLDSALRSFSKQRRPMECDVDGFTNALRELLQRKTISGIEPRLAVDVSCFTSRLLLNVIKVLLEFRLGLRVVYSEAAVYHPTPDEYAEDPDKWTTEERLGLTSGIARVIPSPEHPGSPRDGPNLIIAFPTFKPERTRKIVSDIDPALLLRPGGRIVWIVGDPHMDAEMKQLRKKMTLEINEIPPKAQRYEVCTLDYKETLRILDLIYQTRNLDFHINISALGSKMQSLGTALFWHMRPDVSIYFAVPLKYNPDQYSEGCKATWQIDFGSLSDVRAALDRVGQIAVINE